MENKIRYELKDDGSITISSFGDDSEKIEIPREIDGYRVTGINDRSLFGFWNLKKIRIPDSVISIGMALNYCFNLKEVTVSPDNMKYAAIDNVLFDKDEKKLICFPRGISINEYTVPYGIKEVGDYAFSGCKNISNIVISESVETIGRFAFQACRELKRVVIPSSVSDIKVGAFSECVMLERLLVSVDNTRYATIDNVLFGKNEKVLLHYPAGRSISEYSIPKGTKKIKTNAFMSCPNVISIEIPDSVDYIEANAFCNCQKLSRIIVSGNSETFETIDNVLFVKEHKMLFFYPGGLNNSEYIVPEGTRSIYVDAFRENSYLRNIVIPDSVEKIGEDAFFGLEEELTLTVGRNSYAAEYAKKNEISYTYPDANSWLTE